MGDAGEEAGRNVYRMIGRMYPICRSITGDGVRRTLDIVEERIPLSRYEVPTGTRVFDWEIPREWNIRDAYIADVSGNRLVDFKQHNLHIVSYSMPMDRTMSREELNAHLYSLPERPDWIPYRTSYYNEHWGFCLRHRDLERLGDGPFRVVIDTDLAPGHLTYAECIVPGTTSGQAIVFAHTCHPSMANDNLSGLGLAVELAAALLKRKPRLTWRFIFAPATIGSLTWLCQNESDLPAIEAGIVLGPLGDSGSLTYKRSRQGNAVTDRVAEWVLRGRDDASPPTDFEPYGYDERQFCSPGFNLPVGRYTRSANGKYPEYHTSADDLALVKAEKLADSYRAIAETIAVIDANRRFINLSPKGEPRLGKRGLYGSLGGSAPQAFQYALLWVLSMSDGSSDLLSIAERSGISFATLCQAAEALEAANLLRSAEPALMPLQEAMQ